MVDVAANTDVADGCFVRSLNPLFRRYGGGRVQKVVKGIAKVEYNPSVFMEPPYRSAPHNTMIGGGDACKFRF